MKILTSKKNASALLNARPGRLFYAVTWPLR